MCSLKRITTWLLTQLAWKQVKPILQYHNIIPIHRIEIIGIRIRSHRISKNASYLRVYRHHASYCWKSPSHLTSLTIKYGGATGLSIAICGCFETLTRSPLIYSNEYAKRLVFRRAFRKIWPRAMATAREKRRSAWCNTTFSVTWLGRVMCETHRRDLTVACHPSCGNHFPLNSESCVLFFTPYSIRDHRN